MKSKLLLIIAISLSSQLLAQNAAITDSLSYAMGLQVGESLKQGEILNNINKSAFVDGMMDAQKGQMQMTEDECRIVITNFLQKQYEAAKNKNLEIGNTFLEKNKTQPGIVVLPSGLQYKIEKQGSNRIPIPTDEVEVHYKGALLDGREFDSSYTRNEPATFKLNRVIPGWTEGIQLIGEGGKIILYIPPKLAYGENSPQGSIIEPNSVLVFEVELLKISPRPEESLITPQPIMPPPSN